MTGRGRLRVPRRTAFRRPPVLAALLLAAGCGDFGDAPPAPEDSGIPTRLTDPIEVIRSFALAWSRKDYAALDALLAPDFEFCVLDPTVFPWLGADCWDRTTELGFAANMFDPRYAGAIPPAQDIELQFTALIAAQPAAGTHLVTADALIIVLTGPADGYRADTRVVFTIVGQPDGFLRIRRIEEVPRLLLRADELPGIPNTSWGAVKALYK